MANIHNVQLASTGTTITTGGTTHRNVVGMRIVNTSTTTIHTYSLYLYPSGSSADATTIIKYDKALAPKEDHWFTKDELFRLGNGDVLYGSADTSSVITVTINYEDRA